MSVVTVIEVFHRNSTYIPVRLRRSIHRVLPELHDAIAENDPIPEASIGVGSIYLDLVVLVKEERTGKFIAKYALRGF